ncbi:MAG: DNA replication/repair protein RecF [Saccharofermentanales bacterium]
MRVDSIHLLKFRNYTDIQIAIDSDISVFFGENAQGKTNILEAIYLCSCLRSHRTSKDTDMIKHESDEYEVELNYYDYDNANKDDEKYIENISVSFYESISGDPGRVKNKRIVKQNGIILERMSEFMGLFNAVIFAPEDLMMIKEGPAIRRRFIDILISQIRASYFNDLLMYNKILIQRNSMLKQMRENRAEKDYEQIVIWDISLAQVAARIITTRNYFVDKISEIASKYHNKISSGKEKLNVKYKTISGITNIDSEIDVNKKILEKLKNIFYEDIERGNTMFGPHRDDIEITLDGEGIKPFSSQGQQRTAVLSLKIAELEIIKNETGNTPVLLLDDVMSELDSKRRKMLLSSIGDAQIILTTTDQSHVGKDFLKNSPGKSIHYYEVKNGQVISLEKSGEK